MPKRKPRYQPPEPDPAPEPAATIAPDPLAFLAKYEDVLTVKEAAAILRRDPRSLLSDPDLPTIPQNGRVVTVLLTDIRDYLASKRRPARRPINGRRGAGQGVLSFGLARAMARPTEPLVMELHCLYAWGDEIDG